MREHTVLSSVVTCVKKLKAYSNLALLRTVVSALQYIFFFELQKSVCLHGGPEQWIICDMYASAPLAERTIVGIQIFPPFAWFSSFAQP